MERKKKTPPNAELVAIRRIVSTFEGLSKPARRRVLRYVTSLDELFGSDELEEVPPVGLE